jgi:hypothetical protein
MEQQQRCRRIKYIVKRKMTVGEIKNLFSSFPQSINAFLSRWVKARLRDDGGWRRLDGEGMMMRRKRSRERKTEGIKGEVEGEGRAKRGGQSGNKLVVMLPHYYCLFTLWSCLRKKYLGPDSLSLLKTLIILKLKRGEKKKKKKINVREGKIKGECGRRGRRRDLPRR